MIKKSDSDRLASYFPNADWQNLLWGFTCFSRQNYVGVVLLDAEDEIMLGVQHPAGGCLCELAIRWYQLNHQLVPRLEVFNEAWPLLLTPTFQMVLDQLARGKESLSTPDTVSKLLLACGFTDLSDNPLPGTALTNGDATDTLC